MTPITPSASEPLVAICMATYEPSPTLLRRQLESIRHQTHGNWLCLINDDHSSPSSFEVIERLVGADHRFRLSRSPKRLGFYRNFERLLEMVPDGAAYVALADQDDRWRPEKLETLVASIGDARAVYSDARLVDTHGLVRSSTYWSERRNNHTDLASMLLANTVSGSAALFRRDLLLDALPFPSLPGVAFHDHWLAALALASGRVAYVDEPLYDYVQHEGAALGHEWAHRWVTRRRAWPDRIRLFRSEPQWYWDHWAEMYWSQYGRFRSLAAELERRLGHRLPARKRLWMRLINRGDRSVVLVVWLAIRALRPLLGRNETLGAEGRILRGLAWRLLVSARRRLRNPPRWLPHEVAPREQGSGPIRSSGTRPQARSGSYGEYPDRPHG